MRISLLEPTDPRWTGFLRNVRHDFYHLPAYAEVVAGFNNGTACAVLAEGSGSTMLMPLVKRMMPGEINQFWDGASPYGYGNPLVGDVSPGIGQLSVAEAGAVADWLRDAGCITLFLRSHPLIPGMFSPEGAVNVRHGETVFCRLTSGEADLWSKTRPSHRSEIRRAQREGFEVVIERNPADLSPFKTLYLETMLRLHAKEGYLFGGDYFNRLVAALGDSLLLASVWTNGEMAAAGLFVITCGIMQYHLSGTDDRYRKFAPTKLLIHAVRNWAWREGCEFLHLGGGLGGGDDRLAKFKCGFSADRANFSTTRIIVNAARYAEMLGGSLPHNNEDLRGFFPRYRHPGADREFRSVSAKDTNARGTEFSAPI